MLASIWYEGLPGFRQMNMILQVFQSINYIFHTFLDYLGPGGLQNRTIVSHVLLVLHYLPLGVRLTSHEETFHKVYL